MSKFLELDQLKVEVPLKGSKTFQGRIEASDRIVLQGPSGCGKTIFLKALAGLWPIQSGRLLKGEEDISTESLQKRRCGFVFQFGALFDHLNVFENLAFGLRNFKKNLSEDLYRNEVIQIAQQMDIDSLLDHSIDSLSGGERQRVALGRTMLCEPDYLLMDEPLASLDEETRSRLQDLLLETHQARPIPMLIVSHDQRETKKLATKVVEWTKEDLLKWT